MGKKRERGKPGLWDELKRTKGFTLTPTAIAGLENQAKLFGCDSVSDFIERIGRSILLVK